MSGVRPRSERERDPLLGIVGRLEQLFYFVWLSQTFMSSRFSCCCRFMASGLPEFRTKTARNLVLSVVLKGEIGSILSDSTNLLGHSFCL